MNDIRSEYHNRSTNDIDSLLMHSECSFLLTSFVRSAFVAQFSTCIVFFLFNMSQAKTKYLVHPPGQTGKQFALRDLFRLPRRDETCYNLLSQDLGFKVLVMVTSS